MIGSYMLNNSVVEDDAKWPIKIICKEFCYNHDELATINSFYIYVHLTNWFTYVFYVTLLQLRSKRFAVV